MQINANTNLNRGGSQWVRWRGRWVGLAAPRGGLPGGGWADILEAHTRALQGQAGRLGAGLGLLLGEATIHTIEGAPGGWDKRSSEREERSSYMGHSHPVIFLLVASPNQAVRCRGRGNDDGQSTR